MFGVTLWQVDKLAIPAIIYLTRVNICSLGEFCALTNYRWAAGFPDCHHITDIWEECLGADPEACSASTKACGISVLKDDTVQEWPRATVQEAYAVFSGLGMLLYWRLGCACRNLLQVFLLLHCRVLHVIETQGSQCLMVHAIDVQIHSHALNR